MLARKRGMQYYPNNYSTWRSQEDISFAKRRGAASKPCVDRSEKVLSLANPATAYVDDIRRR